MEHGVEEVCEAVALVDDAVDKLLSLANDDFLNADVLSDNSVATRCNDVEALLRDAEDAVPQAEPPEKVGMAATSRVAFEEVVLRDDMELTELRRRHAIVLDMIASVMVKNRGLEAEVRELRRTAIYAERLGSEYTKVKHLYEKLWHARAADWKTRASNTHKVAQQAEDIAALREQLSHFKRENKRLSTQAKEQRPAPPSSPAVSPVDDAEQDDGLVEQLKRELAAQGRELAILREQAQALSAKERIELMRPLPTAISVDDEVGRLTEQINDLGAKLFAAKTERDKFAEGLRESRAEESTLKERVDDLEAEKGSALTELRRLRNEVRQLKITLEDREQQQPAPPPPRETRTVPSRRRVRSGAP